MQQLSRHCRPQTVREQERQHVQSTLQRVHALDCLQVPWHEVHELPVDGADDELLEEDHGYGAVVEDVERHDGLLVALDGPRDDEGERQADEEHEEKL